jgi:hypothetical protein
LGACLYYFGFVVANAAFVVLFLARLLWTKHASLRRWASMIVTLQVLSWLVLNLISAAQGHSFEVKVGYFVWLASFAMLLCDHLMKESLPNQSPDPAPVAHPAGRANGGPSAGA